MILAGILIGLFGAALVLFAMFSASDSSDTALSLGLAALALAAILIFVGLVQINTTRKENECKDRGGQVVHYGQYGTGVDCIFETPR